MSNLSLQQKRELQGQTGVGGEPASLLLRETGWTFLTNHAHVIICLTQDPEMRMRDIAERVGITERAVQRIIADLEEAGIIVRERDGRRNRYVIHANKPLRHPVEAHRTVGDLIRLANSAEDDNTL